MDQLPELYPDIDQYNSENYDGQSVTIENLDLLIYKIVARTGLSYYQVGIIVKLYFNEIRTEILKGKIVNITSLGKFKIQLQNNKKYKYKILLKFKSSKNFLKKVMYNAVLRERS